MRYCDQVRLHYERQWSDMVRHRSWDRGPINQLPREFCVLECPPRESRSMWTYATCCMSQPDDDAPIEVHLFSSCQNDSHVEMLTIVAHFHRTGARLGAGHTLNLGRPWLPDSDCSFGVLSLPYLDGPDLETFVPNAASKAVRFLWLIPITAAEAVYAKRLGIEALEQRFEANDFNYLDPRRNSVA